MSQHARINVTLFHASNASGLNCLDPAASNKDNLFGPAIYATKDRNVAECQHQSTKAIYQISASGPFNAIIELNQAFRFQEEVAQNAIRSVHRSYRLSTNPDNALPMSNWLNAASAELVKRGVTYPARTLINRALADAGIWLIRGLADGIEATMPQNSGIQWAILSANNIEILEEQPQRLWLPKMI